MSSLRKRDTRVPRRPLLWLAAASLFLLPPMFSGLVAWAPGLLLLSVAAKFWMEPRGHRLRSTAFKLLLAASALVAVFFSYGTVKGIEPGVSLIVVLMAVKILEAHTAREFHFMVLLGWMLCLCGSFLAQDLAITLCLLIAFTLLLVALIQFHRQAAGGAVWPPLGSAFVLLAQALPAIALLFLFFPRVTAGFRLLLNSSSSSAAGFSDQLSPGSVSSLASSSAVAFRAEFPDGKIPRPDALYWRGLVMSQGSGMQWRAPITPISRAAASVHHGQPIRQWITIEPHGAHWMFALDWPAEAPGGAMLAPGDYLWSWQPITKPRRYEANSFPTIAPRELQPRERRQMLETPGAISPAVHHLAQSWVASDPRMVVGNALTFFRTQGFRYSLAPGQYTSLDDFLFRRRNGFCEHYAASFATLMRLAGVPARVVVGYLGGEFNAIGRFFVVRQSDTHAWCEVWLPETGWTRVDPTSVVAPERINLGFETFLERSATASRSQRQYAFARTLAEQPLVTKLRFAWQSLNYAWDTRVLSFDSEAQQTLARAAGLSDVRPLVLLLWSAIGVVVLLAGLVSWMQLRARARPDEINLLYARFCRQLARLGVERAASEGPLAFASRAAQRLPAHSDAITRISHHYIAIRYGSSGGSSSMQALSREVAALRSRKLLRGSPESKPNSYLRDNGPI